VSRRAVEWSVIARGDLEAIADVIAEDNAINALRVVERIEGRAERLATLPERGRIVPELRWHGVLAFREVIEPPWRLVYRVEERRVLVLAVLDGRRQLEDLLLDRLVR
jgi:plasmid stabilization system protein ParE